MGVAWMILFSGVYVNLLHEMWLAGVAPPVRWMEPFSP
jgi:hypothetical protein